MDRRRKIRAPKNKGANVQAHSSTQESPEQKHPYFSLRYLSKKYCLSNCETQEKAAFADTLHKLSQLPWAQIRQHHKHGLGYEKISTNSIKSGIPNHIKPDVSFIAFRFHGKKPMVGYKDGHIFHILWLDRSFTLYDH